MSTVRDEAGPSSSPWDKSCERFSIDEIRRATDNFDEKRVIGKGGFGKVYKAVIGMTGVFAAIKRLDHSRSSQGEPQFWAEIETLSKLRHCHLVSLLGYCNDGQEMILVYEFMPNGTLEDHRARLPWLQRLKICLGAARGLDYLHTGTGTKHGVVHRDVKSSNILLDHNWDAKISDFGLSKIGPTNQTNSFVKTGVKGTIGYIDPCYFSTLRLTRKSDVYSFGVVLFEVLCGRAAVDKSLDEEQWGLAGWVQKCMRDGKLVQIVDSNLRDQISPKCLKAFAGIAGLCLHNDQDQRPTMAEVVVKLFSIVSLQERMNSSPAKWTLKEKVLSFFPAKNQVISDQNKKAGALEFNRNALGGKISESLQYEFESGDKNVDASEFQRHSDETLESLQYEFESIRIATNNFSEANIIRQDETCSIYKGIMEGKIIAVKRLDVLPSHLQQQFRKEMLSLLNLKHKNLVELLGYCMEGSRPCLIYNIVQYTSLDRLIFGHASRDLHLHWTERCDIIVGVAEAILYLHEEAPFKIIHHDIKPDHILLDKRLRPKLSGFGLATSRDRAVVCESSLAGTKRYMAPECFTIPGYVISEKADVYSFGILTLETFLGHRCQDYGYSLRDIWRNWWKGAYSSLIDHSSIMMRYIQIGLLCVQDDVSHRPAMASVVRMLTDTSMSLTVPVIPECHQYDNTRSNLDDTNDPDMALHHHKEVGHYSTRVVDGSSSEDVHGYSLNDNNSDPGTPADEGYISEELDPR